MGLMGGLRRPKPFGKQGLGGKIAAVRQFWPGDAVTRMFLPPPRGEGGPEGVGWGLMSQWGGEAPPTSFAGPPTPQGGGTRVWSTSRADLPHLTASRLFPLWGKTIAKRSVGGKWADPNASESFSANPVWLTLLTPLARWGFKPPQLRNVPAPFDGLARFLLHGSAGARRRILDDDHPMTAETISAPRHRPFRRPLFRRRSAIPGRAGGRGRCW